MSGRADLSRLTEHDAVTAGRHSRQEILFNIEKNQIGSKGEIHDVLRKFPSSWESFTQ
ncbi:MAG: hypothetical protein HBSIN02_15970 [Bacteroidia bacterium]|nr:MAG: hypothetical protein HBSIN02_15970 [Bacteroidia bacterium]